MVRSVHSKVLRLSQHKSLLVYSKLVQLPHPLIPNTLCEGGIFIRNPTILCQNLVILSLFKTDNTKIVLYLQVLFKFSNGYDIDMFKGELIFSFLYKTNCINKNDTVFSQE